MSKLSFVHRVQVRRNGIKRKPISKKHPRVLRTYIGYIDLSDTQYPYEIKSQSNTQRCPKVLLKENYQKACEECSELIKQLSLQEELKGNSEQAGSFIAGTIITQEFLAEYSIKNIMYNELRLSLSCIEILDLLDRHELTILDSLSRKYLTPANALSPIYIILKNGDSNVHVNAFSALTASVTAHGLLSIRRTQGNIADLFGKDIQHSMRLTMYKCRLNSKAIEKVESLISQLTEVVRKHIS